MAAPPHDGEFEFFGPRLGPIGVMIGMPAICYGLVYACNSTGCVNFDFPLRFPGFPAGSELFSTDATRIVLIWMMLLVRPPPPPSANSTPTLLSLTFLIVA